MGRMDDALYEFRAKYLPRNQSFDRVIRYETISKVVAHAKLSSEEHLNEALAIVREIERRDNTEVIQETLEERLFYTITNINEEVGQGRSRSSVRKFRR